jgi:hypothetical protein
MLIALFAIVPGAMMPERELVVAELASRRPTCGATTNSRSGIMAPGTIANKAMSMSRMEEEHEPLAEWTTWFGSEDG